MYFVTGATGTVGRYVVDELIAEGVSVRATSRRPVEAGLPSSVEVVETADDSFPLDRVTAVLINATALGMFTDVGAAMSRLRRLLGGAVDRGVRRVVLLSSASVLDDESPIGAHHRALEQLVVDSGIGSVLVRPGVFSANTLAWASQIRLNGVIGIPFPDAPVAPVDDRDVAAVVARAVLADADSGAGAASALTGPATLTPAQQAGIIADVLGVSVRVREVSPETMRDEMIRAGTPRWGAQGLMRYYAQAMAHPVEISPAAAELIGRAPHTFAEWAQHNAAMFDQDTTG
jgi:uncharacterized protein YbjT (DUF2867 family)